MKGSQGTPRYVLRVQRVDITTLAVDAIVNAANEQMLGGGGVDGAIHRAAGPRLLAACRAVPEVRPGVRCPTGEARITPGFDLPAAHVIHTVGPIRIDGRSEEEALLAACYRNALDLARSHGLASVAFPAISCGVYGFPRERAARIAVPEIHRHCRGETTVADVTLVAFDGRMVDILESAVNEFARLGNK